MKVAIIPARGGSKRIPRKNIKEFCGKPMIAWSIEAALESGCFDQVIVSTDQVEIAKIAKLYGALVPFIRPIELSDDYTPTAAVVRHALEWFEYEDIHTHAICCIYATAPFISPNDIRAGFSLLDKHRCDYVLPVTSFAFPIQRALKLSKNQELRMISPELFTTRSQELEEFYHDAGQFCWGTTKAWLEKEQVFEANTLPLILPRRRVQDIDTQEDWEHAEVLFKSLMQELQS